MTARYEFEVDTTRAVVAWEAEIAQNLAAAQPAGAAGQPAEAGDHARVAVRGRAAGR